MHRLYLLKICVYNGLFVRVPYTLDLLMIWSFLNNPLTRLWLEVQARRGFQTNKLGYDTLTIGFMLAASVHQSSEGSQ